MRKRPTWVSLWLPASSLLLLGIVVFLLSHLFFGRGTRLPDAAPFCHFERGDTLGFSASTRVQSPSLRGMAGNQVPEVKEVRFRLLLSALSHSQGHWSLGGILTQLQEIGGNNGPASAYKNAADIPFVLHLGSDCRVADLGFLPAMNNPARRQISSFFKSVEVLLPAQFDAPTWMRSHEDDVGRYGATYKRQGLDKDGHFLLSKDRGPYISSQQGGQMHVEILAGSASITFDRHGKWLRTFLGNEHLRVKKEQEVLFELRSQISLVRINADVNFPVSTDDLQKGAFVFGDKGLTGGEQETTEVASSTIDPRTVNMDLQTALVEFQKLLTSGKTGAMNDAVAALAQYLRAHKDAAKALLAKIRNGELPDSAHAAAFLALEIAGTKEAQVVLIEALSDPRLSSMNRMRAAAALPDVPKPSKEAAEALIQTATARLPAGNTEAENVATTALLAMGKMSYRLEGDSQEGAGPLAERLRDEIRKRYDTARDEGEMAAALDAIGNTGDERFDKRLQEAAQHQTPLVRKHAARAYSHMDRSVRDPALSDWFGKEESPAVRQAIAETLLESTRNDPEQKGKPQDSVVRMAIGRLPIEADPKVRAVLIQILGQVATSDAAARTALIEQFRRERVPELLSLLGSYLKVEEMR